MLKKRELPEFLRVPWGVRDVVLFIALWFGLQFLLGIGLAVGAHFSPAVNGFINSAAHDDVAASLVFYLVQVLLGFGLVAVCLRRYHATWSMVGWRRVNVLKAVGYLLAILVIFVVLADVALVVVHALIPSFDPNQPQTNDFTQAKGSNRSLALVALVLLPPVFEETIFRGFIFPALAKRAGLIWGAVMSSVIFGIAHGQPNLFVYTSILGLLLCFMYVRTRSIIPGILLHMANNYLAFLAIYSK